jgi:hypothetical protein
LRFDLTHTPGNYHPNRICGGGWLFPVRAERV